MNKFILLIPCSLDLVSVILLLTALNFIPASAEQIINSGTILTTLLFSMVILKVKIYFHHIIGSLLVLIGVILVGTINTIFSS